MQIGYTTKNVTCHNIKGQNGFPEKSGTMTFLIEVVFLRDCKNLRVKYYKTENTTGLWIHTQKKSCVV